MQQTDKANRDDSASPGPLLLGVICLIVAVLGANLSSAEVERDEKEAVETAIAWLVEMTPEDPVAFLSLAVLERRFSIKEFAEMRELYVQEIESASGREQRRLQAFRRLIDAEAVVEAADLEAITDGIDALTGRALNCQKHPLPSGFELTLRTAINKGDYLLTHSALALQWLEENGCSSAWSRRLHSIALQQMAKIIEVDLRVTDLELEAATFLYYMGHEHLVPPGYIDNVLATQREDGGWSGDSALVPETGHWHATSLALWMLEERASSESIPMIPQQKRPTG